MLYDMIEAYFGAFWSILKLLDAKVRQFRHSFTHSL